MKPSRLREAALVDIEQALDYYFEHAEHMVEAFGEAVLAGRRHIEQHPGTGSPRYAAQGKAEALRFWLLHRFPYAIFYVERGDFIDIVRVLHQASDIPTQLDH